MAIFRYELKQYKASMIIWSVSVALAIIFLVPVFIHLMANKALFTDDMMSKLNGNTVAAAMGVNLQSFLTTTGIYAYVTSFIMIAFAVNGTNMGLSIISKEYIQKTADFLMTKPHSRGKVFLSKLLAAVVYCTVIGVIYFAASFFIMQTSTKGEFDFVPFALISLSSILIQFLYLAVGMLIAVIIPNLKTPVVLSTGVAYITFIFGSYSRVVKSSFAGYLSPYSYFNSSYIKEHSSYDPMYLLLFFAVTMICLAVSYGIFVTKDITTVS